MVAIRRIDRVVAGPPSTLKDCREHGTQEDDGHERNHEEDQRRNAGSRAPVGRAQHRVLVRIGSMSRRGDRRQLAELGVLGTEGRTRRFRIRLERCGGGIESGALITSDAPLDIAA